MKVFIFVKRSTLKELKLLNLDRYGYISIPSPQYKSRTTGYNEKKKKMFTKNFKKRYLDILGEFKTDTY